MLISVIINLKWTSVRIIFDKGTEHEAVQLHESLSKIGTFDVIYRMEEVTSSQIDLLANTSFHDAPDIITFVVLCRWETSQQFLKQPFDFDRKNVWRNSLLQYSRWLVGIFHTSTDVVSWTINTSIEFDNVAFMHYNVSAGSDQNQKYTQCRDNNCLSIETLLWSENRRRELTTVGYVYFNGSLCLENDIFPNLRFGFNQRTFLTSLLPWKPYIEIDEVTQDYKGMTIELLKELSHRLNFTYELIHPPDGKWGVASSDNIWNGMLGQLQRKEVDLVAAPLIIDAHRETVADFTQPYFHEKSGIIIKKPVQSHSTKLVDPLNPMVYLCVGISLPVITFLLFLFEKYNPFYRQVAGRMKIRGLHHFSDSFWYMYGALLCQGGEHVAASSAGRTLLSCWWIFCIIIVTTYSGNFVAFLTVTKETLPFNDVEGLVAQNTYKWGTAGETVFETILKNSELPERRKLWNGILEFNQSDSSVLSSDPAEQIRKVRGGNYAFIGERTYLDMAIGQSCDMSIISTDDFHPLLIALPLPNNSPFLKVFSDEIVAIIETGLIQTWMLKTWPKPEHCEETSITDAKSISVSDFQFAFYLTGIGVMLAVLSLIYEYIERKCYHWVVTHGRRQKEQKKITTFKEI
ncbi:GRID1 [Mytilus coruscus]|uniref:GRID1 n=1 Tax=Mytilus coruscus TaxID=42192 RepID=A0A6J8BYR8_MYTCO|nr:GRID1 [Mytilus coruscus]